MKGKLSFFQKKWGVLLASAIFSLYIVAGVLVGILCFPTFYISEAQITTTRDIDSKQMATITTIIKSNEPILETKNKLFSDNIFHYNGDPISEVEISDGLSDWYLNTNAIISIYFKSKDASIIKKVLDTHINTSMRYIENSMPNLKDQIVVVAYGDNPKKASNNRYQVIIGLPISASVLTFGIIETKKILNIKGEPKIEYE